LEKYPGLAVAIGLRAKSGRAIAVVLAGPVDAPAVLERAEITFAGPAERQPYHPVMELPWPQAEAAVRKVAANLESAAAAELGKLVRGCRAFGAAVVGVGIVGAGRRDLARIGNFHIRAHAAEGVLFREVLEAAAEANGLSSALFPERTLEETLAPVVGLQVPDLRARLLELGRAVGSPWRADEKAAALASWAVLARSNGAPGL
jgi:hypothetical protein